MSITVDLEFHTFHVVRIAYNKVIRLNSLCLRVHTPAKMKTHIDWLLQTMNLNYCASRRNPLRLFGAVRAACLR